MSKVDEKNKPNKKNVSTTVYAVYAYNIQYVCIVNHEYS